MISIHIVAIVTYKLFHVRKETIFDLYRTSFISVYQGCTKREYTSGRSTQWDERKRKTYGKDYTKTNGSKYDKSYFVLWLLRNFIKERDVIKDEKICLLICNYIDVSVSERLSVRVIWFGMALSETEVSVAGETARVIW